jgi:uncharacterized protein YecT (DUF1311 family)
MTIGNRIRTFASMAVFILFGSCATTSTTPSGDEVLAELSRRSALSSEMLRPMLSHCDADQQSMYFCAYRDSVAADLTLQRVVAEKVRRAPGCKAPLEIEIAGWERSREKGCAKSAAEDYAGGSMEPTARAACAAMTTNRMIEQLRKTHCPSAH